MWKFVTVITVLIVPGYVLGTNCNNYLNQKGNLETITVQSKHVTEPTDPNASTARPRNRNCPYDFDGSLCKTVAGRVLCGYNMNKGRPYNIHGTIPLNNGCRLRNGRVECGYETGPFTNPRRPPASWDDLAQYSGEKNAQKPRDAFIEGENHVYDPVLKVKSNSFKVHDATQRSRGVTRCVEIQNHIVCRQL